MKQPRIKGKFASNKPKEILLSFMVITAFPMAMSLFAPQTLLDPCGDGGCDVEIVKEVQAKEPEVVIPCEVGVPEYLQCEAAKKNITWEQADIMTAIAKAESGLRPRAKNPRSTASGIFQIVAGTWFHYDCTGNKWDWKDNTNCAIKIMKKSGYRPWEVYNKGTYKKFL